MNIQTQQLIQIDHVFPFCQVKWIEVFALRFIIGEITIFVKLYVVLVKWLLRKHNLAHPDLNFMKFAVV